MCKQRRKVKDFWNIDLKIASSNISFLLFQEGMSKSLPKNLNLQDFIPPLNAGLICSKVSQFLLVRICNPQPIFSRLWRVLIQLTLARGKQHNGFEHNVLTSKQLFSEPAAPALKGLRGMSILKFEYRKIIHFQIFLICILCMTSCHDKEALKQALIEKTVEEKVANHQKKKIQTCSKEAMNEALILADSQMIKLALSQSDSSDRISKPLKPARPEVALPVDTSPIKPLFEDTLLNKKDTILQLQKPKIIAKDSLSHKKK